MGRRGRGLSRGWSDVGRQKGILHPSIETLYRPPAREQPGEFMAHRLAMAWSHPCATR